MIILTRGYRKMLEVESSHCGKQEMSTRPSAVVLSKFNPPPPRVTLGKGKLWDSNAKLSASSSSSMSASFHASVVLTPSFLQTECSGIQTGNFLPLSTTTFSTGTSRLISALQHQLLLHRQLILSVLGVSWLHQARTYLGPMFSNKWRDGLSKGAFTYFIH